MAAGPRGWEAEGEVLLRGVYDQFMTAMGAPDSSREEKRPLLCLLVSYTPLAPEFGKSIELRSLLPLPIAARPFS